MNITEWKDLINKAKKRDVEAQYELGLIFRDGIGVPQDYVLAYMWFLVVIAFSSDNSIHQKAAIKERDFIQAYHLTPSLIFMGSSYASEWIATHKPKGIAK